MIFTSHMLAGAAVASQTNSIHLAVILSFFSHYLLDFIPHSEYSIKNIQERKWKHSAFDFLKILLDFSIGILLILIFSRNLIFAFIGGFAAIIPDGFAFLGFIFPNNRAFLLYREFHYRKIHFWRNKKISRLGKFIAQLLTISVAIFFLLL